MIKKLSNTYAKRIILGILLIVSFACNEFEDIPKIYDPDNKDAVKDPVIRAVEPADSIIAGIRTVIIDGENFSINPDSVAVYFDNYRSVISSFGPNQIIVHRPAIAGDLITLKVMIYGALGIARYPDLYIQEAWTNYADFTSVNNLLYTIDMDKDENMYVAIRRAIYKVNPFGEIETSWSTNQDRPYDIKAGPDNYLYFVANRRDLYRLSTVTGAQETFAALGQTAIVLDFDQNLNIYTGKRDIIVLVKPDRSVREVGASYNDYDFIDFKVYNGYLYVAASYGGRDAAVPDMGVWKSAIDNETGDLAGNELVVDWANSEYGQQIGTVTPTISSMAISEDGDILLSSNDHPQYSLFIYDETQSLLPFYGDTTIMKDVPKADEIVWGSSKSLYINRSNSMTAGKDSTILKLGIGENGADYYGRQ
ncbi:MAG: IPT/TIG domain-containing protein [Calditrichaceae bacterium]|nr:IPT/TIG domain-containing protein [Calditrichaceae bacterium]MBN2708934.1 IPT/TIG domain-containing protein [Calditrichaceae bacterium]